MSEHHRRTLPTAPRRGRLKPSLAGTAALALIASGITLAATPAQAAYTLADATNPDFGSNVTIFDDSMPAPSIQSTLRAAASSMAGDANHWSTERRAFFFKPGTYGTAATPIQSEVGYYTTVAGLGASPDSVTINGSLSVEQELHDTQDQGICSAIGDRYDSDLCKSPGSLNNFWRGMSNLAINPIPNQDFYDTATPHSQQQTRCDGPSRKPLRYGACTSRGNSLSLASTTALLQAASWQAQR